MTVPADGDPGLGFEDAPPMSASMEPHAILDGLCDGAFAVSPDWRFTCMNARARRQLFAGREQLGAVLWDALPDAVENGAGHAWRRAMAERLPVRAEAFFRLPGALFRTDAFPLQEGGLLVFLRGIEGKARAGTEGTDAGPRAWAEGLFAAAPTPLALLRLLPGGQARFEDANPAFLAAVGRAGEDAAGRRVASVLPGEAGTVLAADALACVAAGQRAEHECEIARPAGTRFLRMACVPFPAGPDGAARVLVAATDLTETRRVQAELRQARHLEAVVQLTGGVAHDFNNILTAIMSSLDLLEEDGGEERRRRLIGTAMSAARRGARLTQQLLAYARQQHLVPAPVDVNATVAGMWDMLRRSVGGQVRLATDLAPGCWPALADRTQLEMVLLNLAINARDAMPEGGTLRIATATLPAGDPRLPADAAGGEFVGIEVRDEGQGMTPEVLARATEPFFTTKQAGRGSGLGLAQAYGFARQLGGAVRLDSVPGEGTTVWVFLPRAPQGLGGAPTGSGADRRPCVMLVDDESDVREAAAALLAEDGYRVLAHPDGDSALAALLGGERPAVLLADLAMPGLGGIELARRARETWPALPVLFLTGHADPEAVAGLEGDALVKPYRRQDLLAAVRRVLDAPSAS